jgi:hypothetical protein
VNEEMIMSSRSSLGLALVVALALPLVGGGCGTVLGKGRAPVQLTSSPAGADVYVDGVHQGRTPVEVTVSTSGAHRIEFQLDGRTGTCEVEGGVSGMWVALDIAMGLIPLVVDAATGGWRGLDFDTCHARFPAP